MKSMQLNISGIEVFLSKNKGQKNLYLRVCPPDGMVKVSAPAGVSDAEIEKFVLSKIEMIKRHQKRILLEARMARREFVTGEEFYLFGMPFTLQVVLTPTNKKSKVEKFSNKLILCVPKGSTSDFRKRKIDEWYRVELTKAIEDMLKPLQKRVGVCASEFRIKDMKTRWGTCNVRDARIWINLQLAKKPIECLEYVMVHELCHLLERNHTKRFWSLVEQFCPNWKEAKKSLDEMLLGCNDDARK